MRESLGVKGFMCKRGFKGVLRSDAREFRCARVYV